MGKIAEKGNQVAKQQPKTMTQLVTQMTPQFKMALGNQQKAERFARIILSIVNGTPEVARCNPKSILGAAMQAVQIGLDPGIGGSCYLVPYGNNCTFQMGYKGLITLFYRSKKAESLDFGAIYPNDQYIIKKGLNPEFDIIPAERNGEENPIAYYAIAKLTTGGSVFHVMYNCDVIAHRAKSKQASSNKLWDRDPKSFGYKTVIIQLMKRLPLEYDIMASLDQDMTVKEVDETEHNIDMTEKVDQTDYTVEDVEPEEESKGSDLSFDELLNIAKQEIKAKKSKIGDDYTLYNNKIDECAQNGNSKQALELINTIKEL